MRNKATNIEKNGRVEIVDCGLADYQVVLERQKLAVEQRRTGLIPDTVLVVEHHPVITLGARKSANMLITGETDLAQQGIDLVPIRRGGGTTAHNPGQLVFYPILDLQTRNLGIGTYIRTLEAIGIALLSQYAVCAQQKKGFPGLWVDTRKIASIGVRVSRQITYHGMAINIQNDLQIFNHFVPCGLDGVEMTSVKKETGQTCDMTDTKDQLALLLQKHLNTT
jgi:lipoate-protein ligase B